METTATPSAPTPPAASTPQATERSTPSAAAVAQALNSASDAPKGAPEGTEAPKENPRLSPRFAELARREREIARKQQELKAQDEQIAPLKEAFSKAKENPVGLLQAAGLSYADLTDLILSEGKGPEPEDRVTALERKLAEKEEREAAALAEAQAAQVQEVITGFQKQIEETAKADPEKYELVTHTGSYGLVYEVVEEYFAEHGKVLPLETALQVVEAHLEEEALRLVNAKKVAGKLAPPAPIQDKTEPNQSKQGFNLNNRLSSEPAPTSERLLPAEEAKARSASMIRWK